LLRRGSQDARRYAFTLCAEQSTTFTLDEDPAVVSVHGGERILHWRGCDVVLDVDRVTPVGSVDLETFVEGAYVHGVVRLRPSTLVARILEVAAALPVLVATDADKRVASLAPTSEDVVLDLVDRVLQAIRRLAREASERTDPEGYVRSVVRQRLKHVELATEGEWITRFARGVRSVARASETSFEAALAALGVHASPPVGEAPLIVPLGPEPVHVGIRGQGWIVRSVCVRDVEHVLLQHPSSFVAAVQDQLVVPFMGGVLVGVRDAGQFVAMHLPNLEIEAVADVSLV
jgi:hypothetical protein